MTTQTSDPTRTPRLQWTWLGCGAIGDENGPRGWWRATLPDGTTIRRETRSTASGRRVVVRYRVGRDLYRTIAEAMAHI